MKKMLVFVFFFCCFTAHAGSGVIKSGDTFQLNVSNSALGNVLKEVARKMDFEIISRNLRLQEPVTAQRKFRSVESGLNFLLKDYNKIFIYDGNNKITQVRILGVQSGVTIHAPAQEAGEEPSGINLYPEQPASALPETEFVEKPTLDDETEDEEQPPLISSENDFEEQPPVMPIVDDNEVQPPGDLKDVDIAKQPPLIIKGDHIGVQPPI